MKKKLDMNGFEYRNGNSVKFKGVHGVVELIYHEAKIVPGGTNAPGQFEALLWTSDSNERPAMTGIGATGLDAVHDLYVLYAGELACRDCNVRL